MQAPYYIAIEGMDYAGKSTLIKALETRLSNIVSSVTITREPGGTPLAEKIRDMVVSDECTTEVKLPLFIASRLSALRELLDATGAGNVLVSDRCFMSSAAMQTKNLGGSNFTTQEIIKLHHDLAVPFPDLIFYIDISYDEMVKRHSENGSRNDLDDWTINNYSVISNNYLEASQILSLNYNTPTFHLHAQLTTEQMLDRIEAVFHEYLKHIS